MPDLTPLDLEELKRLQAAAVERFSGSRLESDSFGLQIWADGIKDGERGRPSVCRRDWRSGTGEQARARRSRLLNAKPLDPILTQEHYTSVLCLMMRLRPATEQTIDR